MQPSDKKRFATLITGISDYYGKTLSDGVIGLYWEGLRQYDLPAVERALWDHAKNPDTGQYMPKIADVTRMLQGRTTDQASLAWTKVDTAVRRIGTYSDVVFDDPIIHRVLGDMGGWIAVGAKEDKEWPFLANEFKTRYQGYKLRGEVPDYQPVMVGIANAHNGKEGFRTAPPMLIGDERRAKQVMLAGTNEQLVQMNLAGDTITELAFKRIENAA